MKGRLYRPFATLFLGGAILLHTAAILGPLLLSAELLPSPSEGDKNVQHFNRKPQGK